jgi:MFS family permease
MSTDFLPGLYSVAIIIFPEVANAKQKQYIAGIIGMVIAMAGVLGPVLGGILTHYASWRWIFWIKYVQLVRWQQVCIWAHAN